MTLELPVKLREVAETVRESLLELATVSQANILGAKPFQIDVEISEDNLRKHGLSLANVAQILRRENIELPGGQLKSDGQEILLRGKNRREFGQEIEQLPVIVQQSGVVLRIADLGNVHDEFDDKPVINEVNGKPALVVSIDRTADEDLIRIADAVHAYVDQAELPSGYSLQVWGDTSVDVADRMRMLRSNGIQGLCFVFILLALFLEFRLAFWVSLGIPICVLGAGVILLLTGQTLNMLSMFAFLMALGIVVDDAIVVGENIYEHRKLGKPYVQAAIDGTVEVLAVSGDGCLYNDYCFHALLLRFWRHGQIHRGYAGSHHCHVGHFVDRGLDRSAVPPVTRENRKSANAGAIFHGRHLQGI